MFRRGVLLLGGGSVLLPWLMLNSVRPEQDRFPLFPTVGYEPARGTVSLRQPWSPYGVTLSEQGRFVYELTVEVAGLPRTEGTSYRVWLTTPAFAPIVELGTIQPSGEISGETDLSQLIVVVSREEAGAAADRWTGPIVLRGFSRAARVRPLYGHSVFQQTPM